MLFTEKLEDIAPWLKENIQAGDLIITMGAGNIYIADLCNAGCNDPYRWPPTMVVFSLVTLT